MKKLIFAFIAMFSIVLASCNNTTNVNPVDTDTVSVDSLDSISVNSVCLD